MFDRSARRARLRPALGRGLFFALPASLLSPTNGGGTGGTAAATGGAADGSGPGGVSGHGISGHGGPRASAPFFSKPSAISTVPDEALPNVCDLVLYTLERCELNALRAGFEGSGISVYIDCENCGLNTLRRWATAVRSKKIQSPSTLYTYTKPSCALS
jgi:hypothetical protein